MFKYDEQIDSWSHDMIKDLTEIWGNEILKANHNMIPFTTKYLIAYLNSYAEEYGQKILDRFDLLMGSSCSPKDIGYYVNTTPVSLHSSSQQFISISGYHSFIAYPTVIAHEICHLYFYNFLRSKKFLSFNQVSDIAELLTESQENEVKEMITIILNLEFLDLINQDDPGYPHHQIMRRELQALWLNKPDFISLVSEAIKIYKKG
jgi:hypothetical protein